MMLRKMLDLKEYLFVSFVNSLFNESIMCFVLDSLIFMYSIVNYAVHMICIIVKLTKFVNFYLILSRMFLYANCDPQYALLVSPKIVDFIFERV